MLLHHCCDKKLLAVHTSARCEAKDYNY